MPESDIRVNKIVAGIQGQCPAARMGALIEARNLLSGPIAEKPAGRLIQVLTNIIHVEGTGMAARPLIECHTTRLAAVDAVSAAVRFGHDLDTTHLTMLQKAMKHDPHSWVAGAAETALDLHNGRREGRASFPPRENTVGIKPTLLRPSVIKP